jgi:hypothetical protein
MDTTKQQVPATGSVRIVKAAIITILILLFGMIEIVSAHGDKTEFNISGNDFFSVEADTIKPAEPEPQKPDTEPESEPEQEAEEPEYDPHRPPATINEAVQKLSELIPNHEVAIIRRTTEEEFTGNAIATLGAWMKQEWDLVNPEAELANYFYNNEIYNPDEMAEVILIVFWRRLNGVPVDLDRLFLERLRYWDELLKDGP